VDFTFKIHKISAFVNVLVNAWWQTLLVCVFAAITARTNAIFKPFNWFVLAQWSIYCGRFYNCMHKSMVFVGTFCSFKGCATLSYSKILAHQMRVDISLFFYIFLKDFKHKKQVLLNEYLGSIYMSLRRWLRRGRPMYAHSSWKRIFTKIRLEEVVVSSLTLIHSNTWETIYRERDNILDNYNTDNIWQENKLC